MSGTDPIGNTQKFYLVKTECLAEVLNDPTNKEPWVVALRDSAPDADGNGTRGDSKADISALLNAINLMGDESDNADNPKYKDSDVVSSQEVLDYIKNVYGTSISAISKGMSIIMGLEPWMEGLNKKCKPE